MRHWLLLLAVALAAGGCQGGRGKEGAERTRSSGRVSWAQAQTLVRDCRVKGVAQTHRQVVTLTLRNGGVVVTHEPRIDDIVHAINRVSSSCGPITLATE